MRLIEVNFLHIGISLLDGFVKGRCGSRYAEYAAAVRYQLAVLDGGAAWNTNESVTSSDR